MSAAIVMICAGTAAAAEAGADVWWSERTGGWIGAGLGGLIGLLGGLIGVLSGFHKAKTFVLTVMKLMLMAGIVSLALGVAAIFASQPYAVYYPLLLIGVICTAVIGFTYPMAKRGYQMAEMQKIKSMDAMNR
ncbi:MAG: hypothetical protein GXY33_18655 [Phycisphaerae bacterium]|nr:hypothetical protein [Phycisphaerae bacterium]